MKQNRFIILILFLCCIFSILPLLHPGFFVTDDGGWMIIRFSSFYQAFADGQFPVRFLHRLNFDFGYPVATFLYPGFMYFGIPFHVLKIGFVETIKIILGLSLIGTTLFTFLWLDKVFKNKLAAFVGGLASLYLPYHLYDIYTRGSVGEIFALMWIPFVFWMIERNNSFFVSIGIFLLLISHNTIALFSLPLLFVYAFLRKIFSLKQLLINFVFGILLSSFFIIPATFELQYTRFYQTTISDPTNYFANFYLLGLSTLFIFIIAGSLFVFQKRKDESTVLIWLFLLITFLAAFLSSSWSLFLWQFIPSSFIQFPFRLLSYLVISVAFLGAFIVSRAKKDQVKILTVVVLLIIIFASSYQFATPKEYINKGEGFYSTNEATTTVQDEYIPVWVKEKPSQRAGSKVQIVEGEGKIENMIYNNKEIKFDVETKGNVKLRINTIYWLGWEVFVNDKKVKFSYDNPKGVIDFEITKGKYQVRAEFGETPLRLISDLISVLSLIILLFISKGLNKK